MPPTTAVLSGSTFSGRVLACPYDDTAAIVVDPPYRLPDLSSLSAPARQLSEASAGDFVAPPRGQLRGLSALDGMEWLYQLDDCGDLYAVELQQSRATPSAEQEQRATARRRTAPDLARPSIWVHDVDTRPETDSRALVQLLMEGVAPGRESDTSAGGNSGLGAIARLKSLGAIRAAVQTEQEEQAVPPRAGEVDDAPDMDLLKLPRHASAPLDSRKRARNADDDASNAPGGWLCCICEEQSTDTQWASLRNRAAADAAGVGGSPATDRLCRSCTAVVETAMRDELQTRAQAERAPHAPRKPEHEAWTMGASSGEEQRVPAEMRDAVLGYVTACPRTLHEVTTWLQRSLRVEEGAVEFFLAELNGVVSATAISDRVSSPGAIPTRHLAVYSFRETEDSGPDALRRLWQQD